MNDGLISQAQRAAAGPSSAQPLVSDDVLLKVEAKQQKSKDKKRTHLLMAAYAVLFTRYGIATFLSSFFSTWADNRGITATFDGVIFMAYPLGMALTSLFAPQLIKRVGTRTAVSFGLLSTSLFTLLFGVAPDLVAGISDDGAQLSAVQWLFFWFYFFNGLTGALAETSCIILVSARFQDRLGTVMASIGTVSGVGCMVGPPLGGVLFDAAGGDDAWAFRLPFVVFGAITIMLTPVLHYFVPQEHIAGDDATPPDAAAAASPPADAEAAAAAGGAARRRNPICEVLSLSVCLGLASVALSGSVVATLDPTLAYRMRGPPWYFSDAWLSFFFLYSSIVYTFVSVPVGWLVDRFPDNARAYKTVTALGFVVLALTFALLAPIGLSAWGVGDGGPDAAQAALNNLPTVAVAMVLKGVGSALSNNAVYPDLVLGFAADDALLQATISALWNAAYAVGWAAGPLLGGALYDAALVNKLCYGAEQQTCFAPPSPPPLAPLPPLPPPSPPGVPAAEPPCLCDWMPNNGFDGFASGTAVVSLAFAVVLLVAAAFNVGAKKPAADRPSGSTMVEPLVAADI